MTSTRGEWCLVHFCNKVMKALPYLPLQLALTRLLSLMSGVNGFWGLNGDGY